MDLLPEWLDEESKQWLLMKLSVFEKLRELEAMYKFYWDVFKGFIGVEDRFDEPSESLSVSGDIINQAKSSEQDYYSDFGNRRYQPSSDANQNELNSAQGENQDFSE